MSKVLYLCARNRAFDPSTEIRLREICCALEPDNAPFPLQHEVESEERIAWAVMNQRGSLQRQGNSLLLGTLFQDSADWDQPGSAAPDGSFALIRQSADLIEIVCDPVASRTIWYFHDNEIFAASTSQRALAMWLGDFQFDDRIIPWMLATGSLGPLRSWDQRFRRLPVDSSATLDRHSWSLDIKRKPIEFSEVPNDDVDNRRSLERAIEKTMTSLRDLDFDDWVLPLSGGYDSRAILCYLTQGDGPPEKLRTITWGLEEAIHQGGNDASVALDLAKATDVKHVYLHTDVSSEPIDQVIDRFLACGEGRIDHLGGYMDGMKIWSDLIREGVAGIIRGDEGFGWSGVSSPLTVRFNTGGALCTDFSNLGNLAERFGLPEQEVPEELLQQSGETLEAWRDRLYHIYRLPTILAALSEIKLSYVEQINPLLSRDILEQVRKLPDRVRTDKALFREIVDSISPDVPYADRDAHSAPEDILRSESMVKLMRSILTGASARSLFSSEFLEFILEGLAARKPQVGKKASLKKSIKRRVPGFLKNLLRDSGVAQLRVDGSKLAFRVFIIVRMNEILRQDATRGE